MTKDNSDELDELAGTQRGALTTLLKAFEELTEANTAALSEQAAGDAQSVLHADRAVEFARDNYRSAHDRLRFTTDLANQRAADRQATALTWATRVLAGATIALVIATVGLWVATANGHVG